MPSAVPVPMPRKPRVPWSAIVHSSDPKISGKELAEKVRKEIAPTVGVRLHEVRGLARGGAIIRTPLSGEIQKVVANKKFVEAGLEVKQSPAQTPKIVVSNVDTATPPDEFMSEMFKKNFADKMSQELFKRQVRLEKSWSQADGATVNVTLEVSTTALDVLDGEKAYIGWFAYNCRALVRTYASHRCVGFDHKIKDCRYKENVCRQCGQTGHSARVCQSPVDCRNCRFKGYALGHHMLSPGCLVYAAVLARVNSRH